MKVTITGLPDIGNEEQQQCLGRDFLMAIYYHGCNMEGIHVEFEQEVGVQP